MFAYYMERPNTPAPIITKTENFMVKHHLEHLIPTIEELWYFLRAYKEPPHFFNCYACLLFANLVNGLVLEYDLKEEDFDYYINGLDTHLYYQGEEDFFNKLEEIMVKKQCV
ncbi:hypothetical protein CL176_05570 [Suicoccus acidiformans]|uniref:Uncharacterized protein n=1 Tax=Suicoccus acidiformans TaxID=2036206 RepID=A0A347WK97_9LACT|nr:hypothetical protein [Suicoccus acidiformans]AXY25504.1 hypothetical protein CL176_05570 [Suicoccus acidiformans]